MIAWDGLIDRRESNTVTRRIETLPVGDTSYFQQALTRFRAKHPDFWAIPFDKFRESTKKDVLAAAEVLKRLADEVAR